MADDIKTVVTKREETVPASVTANTPSSTPSDVQVVAMNAFLLIAIRALRVYLQSIAGLVSAGGVGLDSGILPDAFGALVVSAATIALGPAFFSALTNTIELLTKVDQNWPEFRA